MKKVLSLILLIFILCGCSNHSIKANKVDVMMIDPNTVYNIIDNKEFYIIDVREYYEYASGHIKNAKNIPFTNISSINKLMIPFDSKIIVYCLSGNRSKKAANQLVEMGYTNVYDMGGITNWNYELIKE